MPDLRDFGFRPFDRPHRAPQPTLQRPAEATQTSHTLTLGPKIDTPAGWRSPWVVCAMCDARGPAVVRLGRPGAAMWAQHPMAGRDAPWKPVLGSCRGSPLLERACRSRSQYKIMKRTVSRPNLEPRCRFQAVELPKTKPRPRSEP